MEQEDVGEAAQKKLRDKIEAFNEITEYEFNYAIVTPEF